MKKTLITFDQAGNMKVDNTGFVGRACEETTAKLMVNLGADRTSEDKKPEYYQQQSSQQAKAAQRW